MEERKGMFKRLLFVISFAIILFVALFNLDVVFGFLGSIFKILNPIIIGVIVAFILNIFMKIIEFVIYKIFPNKKIKVKAEKKENGKSQTVYAEPTKFKRKIIRTISICLTLLLVFFIIKGLILFIIPQIYDSVENIVKEIPAYVEELKITVGKMQTENKEIEEIVNQVYMYVQKNSNEFISSLSSLVPQAFQITKNITSGIFDTVLSLILAIYFLISKETLIRNSKKVIYALLNKKTADYIAKIAAIANTTFQAFVRGQLIEAIVIGALCYIGMLIFKMPYAMLISVIVSLTALIPIFGAWIGGAIGAFLLLTVAPAKAIAFIIFIVILQQLEGNLIYPKVVGNSVGISGLWVLIALIIGSAIAGVPGILIGIPTFATIYTLFGEHINNKLEQKKIKI